MTCLLYPWARDLVPIVQEAGWASGPVWMGTEDLAPTGIFSPDCRAHSKLLYLEVVCYIKKYNDSLQHNIQIQKYST
jgi:hypothetical protein